jgi:hypothetical protein
MNTASKSFAMQPPSSLGKYYVYAYADTSGKDEVMFCNSNNCYSEANADTVLDLYQSWNLVEWNVFGNGGSSTANFNSGAYLAPDVYTYSSSEASSTRRVKQVTDMGPVKPIMPH